MFCEFVVIAFLTWFSHSDQIAFLGQLHSKYFREFVDDNEWELTYPNADIGSKVIDKILDQKKNDKNSPIDYAECLQPNPRFHYYSGERQGEHYTGKGKLKQN
jgi:hypothetical protein